MCVVLSFRYNSKISRMWETCAWRAKGPILMLEGAERERGCEELSILWGVNKSIGRVEGKEGSYGMVQDISIFGKRVGGFDTAGDSFSTSSKESVEPERFKLAQ